MKLIAVPTGPSFIFYFFRADVHCIDFVRAALKARTV